MSQRHAERENSVLSGSVKTVSLKGQASTGGSGLPLRVQQKAVTARADTAENICSCGSLVRFRRSFGHYSKNTDSQGRSNWTAGQEDRLLNSTIVGFRAIVNCRNWVS